MCFQLRHECYDTLTNTSDNLSARTWFSGLQPWSTAKYGEAAPGICTGRLGTEKLMFASRRCFAKTAQLLMEALKGGRRKHTNVDFNRGPNNKRRTTSEAGYERVFFPASDSSSFRETGKCRPAATVNCHEKKNMIINIIFSLKTVYWNKHWWKLWVSPLSKGEAIKNHKRWNKSTTQVAQLVWIKLHWHSWETAEWN